MGRMLMQRFFRYAPQLNETAMVKYFTYDNDNWVSYDDQETIVST